MATGGNVSGRKGCLEIDSTVLLSFRCCVCTKENKRSEAVKYCVTCEDYYCTECIKLHDKVPTLSGHVIVDKSDFKGPDGGKELPSIPTERCATQPAKIVDMYCKTHDRVGCATCMASTHDKSCTKLYIPENIDVLFNTEKIKRSEQLLRFAIQKVEASLRLREMCIQDVLKFVDVAGEQLENYTYQLIQAVTELKQNTQDRLDSIRIDYESVLFDQSSALNKELAVAKEILQKLTVENSESNNKSLQITCSNLAVMTTQKCEETNKNLVCPDIKEIPFRPHVTCEELFNILLINNSLEEFSLLPSRKQNACVPCRIVKKVEKSVKIKSDKKNCDINGSCILHDRNIVLADNNNRCLKRLSPRATSVSDCLQLPDRPFSVAAINNKEAAVTLPRQKKVQIIALDATMTTTRTLDLDFKCYGVTHYNNELFVSDSGNTVYVYTVASKLLRQFSRDNTGKALFSDIRNMAVSDSGRVLFVADWEKGLIAVERESGRQLWCYSGEDLVNAHGVCVDGRGGIFVCGWGSHNVLQLSESGEKIGEIVTRADGILGPWSVC